jgi:hypothetical protein
MPASRANQAGIMRAESEVNAMRTLRNGCVFAPDDQPAALIFGKKSQSSSEPALHLTPNRKSAGRFPPRFGL